MAIGIWVHRFGLVLQRLVFYDYTEPYIEHPLMRIVGFTGIRSREFGTLYVRTAPYYLKLGRCFRLFGIRVRTVVRTCPLGDISMHAVPVSYTHLTLPTT